MLAAHAWAIEVRGYAAADVTGYGRLVGGIPVEWAGNKFIKFGIEHEAECAGARPVKYVSIAYSCKRIEYLRPLKQVVSIFFGDRTGCFVRQFTLSIRENHSVEKLRTSSDFLLNIWDDSPRKQFPAAALNYINRESLPGVDENAGGAIDLNPVADQVHVANLCDIDTAASPGACSTPLITHADGTLVSMSSPAKTGEEIVIWALGLGATQPAVPTGQATPSPAPVAQTLQEVNYEYQLNAGPWRGVPYLSVCYTTVFCPNTPVFAGLTPGYVGLYQVNFVIPGPPPGTACAPPIANNPTIVSNLTLTLVGSTSFDGAGICVEVGSGVP